ncbi:MAG: VWA domain-containing protein [Rhodobacterales bacterium]|nr:VWA domain-containing protein [Rhodobacterales bacterium]
MSNNVRIIREAITKVTKMLSGMNVEVTQRGHQAFVQYHPATGKVRRVNIPYLPDNASEELIAATQGFLDHEVAHALFTDGKSAEQAFKDGGKILHTTHNIVEDCFIELRMAEQFRGSEYNLGNVRKLVFDTRARPEIAALTLNPTTTEAQWFQALMVTMLRAMAGHRECIDFMNEDDKWSRMPNIVKLLDFFPEEIARCKNSWETLALAKRVLDVLRDASTPPPPPPSDEEDCDEDEGSEGGTEPSDSKKGKSKSKPEEGGDSEDDEGDEGEGGGAEEKSDDATAKPSKGKKPEKKEEPKSDDTDEGEGSDTKEEDSAETEKPEADDEGDEGDSEGEGADDADDSDGEDTDEGDEGEDTGEGEDSDGEGTDEGDSEGEGADDGGDDEDDSEGDDGVGEGDESDLTTDDTESDDEPSHSEDDPEHIVIDEAVMDAILESKDFEASMTVEIKKLFVSDIGSYGSWTIFSREHGEPVPYDKETGGRRGGGSVTARDMTAMIEEVNHMIGPMSKQLERLILAQRRTWMEPGKRTGRLNPTALHRIKAGDDRVFRNKREKRLRNTVVSVLVDMSGSMHGSKMTTAAYSAYALAQMLSRVNIPFEILTFSSLPAPRAYHDEMRRSEAELGRNYSQQDICHHMILKGFNERMTPDVAERFAHLGANKATKYMYNNCDPESVEIAARRLAVRSEERKILMVLSDGQPAFEGDVYAAQQRLKDLVPQIERAGVETIGIGIEDSSVKYYYPKHVVLRDVRSLPAAIMKEMKALLLK